jgi:hypothetical protein
MNHLYLIERTDDARWYGEHWGFIISAPSKPHAVGVASNNCRDEGSKIWQAETTIVSRITEGGTKEPTGVILSDYRAE